MMHDEINWLQENIIDPIVPFYILDNIFDMLSEMKHGQKSKKKKIILLCCAQKH